LEEFKQVPDESIFFDITPDEASLFFYIFGLAIAQPLTIDEINVLANGLFEMAQVLFVISSQRTLLNDVIKAQQEKQDAEKAKDEKKASDEMESAVKKLQDQIERLQKQVNALQK